MMKKKFLFVIYVLIFVPLFARGDYDFSFSPITGFMYGQVNEYVMYSPEKDDMRKLSELNWDVSTFYAGLDTTFQYKSFFINTITRMGIPARSGVMQDNDWVNVYTHFEDNWQTNFSIHENYLENFIDMGLSAGWEFYLPWGFIIKPDLFIRYNTFSFSSKNGYKQYGKAFPDHYGNKNSHLMPYETGKKEWFDGKVITYNQTRIFEGIGFGIYKNFGSFVDIYLHGTVRYALVEAIDCHLLTNYKYLDQPTGFGGMSADAQVKWNINRNNGISVSAEFDWLPFIVGADYGKSISTTGNWDTDSEILGGASSMLFSLSISYTLTF